VTVQDDVLGPVPFARTFGLSVLRDDPDEVHVRLNCADTGRLLSCGAMADLASLGPASPGRSMSPLTSGR
jgi:hypothetical protein